MIAPYTAGTISLVSGSPTVVGTDTAWGVSLIIGGTIYVEFDGGNPLPIATVDSDTEITAALNWTGPTGTYAYAIVRDTAYGQQTVANAQALATYIQRLNNPALAATAGVTPGSNKLLLFTGANSATIIDLEDLLQGVKFDEEVPTLADRATYDGEAEGFRVLVANIGDGRSAFYTKKSAAVGDWTVPFYITGPVGGAGPYTDITIGPTETLPAGADAEVTLVPVSPGVIRLDFGLPKGLDGTGTGDVVGPIGGVVSGSFAYYSDTSGKSLGATSKLVATQHRPNDINDSVLNLRQFGDGWLIRGRTWNNQNESGLWFDSSGGAEFAARNANGSLISSYRADRCSVAGPISGTAKNFEIDHPADPENYDLRHCATESPEMLVEYRGIATLVDGRAVVDVERYFGVMENTFANLWIDAWVASLQNQTSFARVMPSSVLGASFEIVCEDGSSEDVIAWHLTARRNDAYVRWSGCPFTDSDGRLIIEFEKEERNE